MHMRGTATIPLITAERKRPAWGRARQNPKRLQVPSQATRQDRTEVPPSADAPDSPASEEILRWRNLQIRRVRGSTANPFRQSRKQTEERPSSRPEVAEPWPRQLSKAAHLPTGHGFFS